MRWKGYKDNTKRMPLTVPESQIQEKIDELEDEIRSYEENINLVTSKKVQDRTSLKIRERAFAIQVLRDLIK